METSSSSSSLLLPKFTGSALDYPRFRSYINHFIIKNDNINDNFKKLMIINQLLPPNDVHIFDCLGYFNQNYQQQQQATTIDLTKILNIMDDYYGGETRYTLELCHLIDRLPRLISWPSLTTIRLHLNVVQIFNNFCDNRWITNDELIEFLQGTLLYKISTLHIQRLLIDRKPSMKQYERQLFHLQSLHLNARIDSVHPIHQLQKKNYHQKNY